MTLTHLQRSARYLELGKVDQAMRESLLAEKERPDDCLVWMNRSQVQRAMGRTNDAIASAQKAIHLTYENTAPPYSFTIGLLVDYGKLADAQTLTSFALNDPRIQSRDIPHARVLSLQAKLFSIRGDPAKALEACDEALRILSGFDKGTCADILKQKAEYLLALGRQTEAASASAEAAALKSEVTEELKQVQGLMNPH